MSIFPLLAFVACKSERSGLLNIGGRRRLLHIPLLTMSEFLLLQNGL